MPVYIDATGCPNACRHCGRSARPPYGAHYSLGELRDIAHEWGPLCIDAEPSAHPEFPEILSPDIHPCEGVLATNGFGFARATEPAGLFARLRELGYWALSFTFHGLERRHDWFVRRRGAFRDLVVAGERALSAGFRLHWNIYLDCTNLENVPPLMDLHAREFPGSLWIGVPMHLVSERLWRYESLRPTAGDVAARLPNLRDLAPQQWPQAVEEYTEARWIERWKADATICAGIGPWTPTVAFDELQIHIFRERQVFLSPECAPRVLLGKLAEGRSAIEARLRALAAAPRDIDPWTAEAHLPDLDRLHHSCDSVRHEALSAAYYYGAGAADTSGLPQDS